MVPLEQFDGDVAFVLYSSSPKKSMATTTIGGCSVICEGGDPIWRRRCDLEVAARFGGVNVTGGRATGDRRELHDARFFL
jgi:hypothetical protein